MGLWRQIRFGLRNLFFSGRRHSETREEVEQYLREEAEELRSRGVPEDEARRSVRLNSGDASAVSSQIESHGWENLIGALARDLRFAWRQILRKPGFSLVAVLILALGIGANAAIFTVVQSILLAPLPYAHADRLVALQTHFANLGRTSPRVTGPDAVDVASQAHSLEAVTLYSGGELGVQLRDHAVYTVVTLVDASFAKVFGLEPIAGRVFSNTTSDRGLLVSETFARDNFGGAQAALGQVLHIENEALPVVGVLPSSFTFPEKTQVWEAYAFHPEAASRTAFNFRAVGRVRDGVTIQAAQAELDGLSLRMQAAHPTEDRGKQFRAVPLQKALTGDARPTLLLLWATVGVILLIACVNVTHLQMVRSMERQREIAVRKALGSSAARVLLPVVLESVILSILGGVAGLALSTPAVRMLVALAPRNLPRSGEIHVSLWALVFTFGVALIAALASSLFPAMRALRVESAEALKHDASRGLTHRGAGRLRDGLVVGQIASTFVLTLGAALFLHTMNVLMDRDMGFDGRQLLIVDADAPAHTEQDAVRSVEEFHQIFGRLSALPGVTQVAGIMGLPAGAYGSNGYYNVRGGLPVEKDHAPSAVFSVASPGYFGAMGIPLKRGRDFTWQDTLNAPFVTVISESAARQSFGDIDPIGKQIQCGLDSPKWMTVVGVVGDVRQDSPAQQPGPALYMPMAQHVYYANQINIVVRTRVKPLSVMEAAQAQIAQVNPLIALRFTTMGDLLGQSVEVQRFRAVLLTCFAGVGFLLAMLGVYGTLAYSVAQRRVEIGIRMAFGAERRAILGDVLGHAGRLALWGIVAGVALSFALSRLVESMLVGVRPLDPVSLVAAAMLLLAMAMGAALAPGLHATRIDPMAALRME